MNPVPVTVPVTNPVPVNLYAVDVPPRDSTSAEQQKQCQIIVHWVDEHGKGNLLSTFLNTAQTCLKSSHAFRRLKDGAKYS